MVRPLDERDAAPGAEQVQCGGQPGEARADHHDVVGGPRDRPHRAHRRRRVAATARSASRGRGRLGHPARAQGVECGAGQRGDALLDRLDGTQLVEQVADPVEAGVVELRVADGLLDLGHRVRRAALGRPLDGQGEQQRPLALAQVVARGLAGHRGVAEHPEQVVAQLERHPDVRPEAAVTGHQVRFRTGDRRAEVQWPFDGVRGRLVAVDLQCGARRRIAGGLDEHVEVLPAEHLRAHRLPRGRRAGGGVGVQSGTAQHVVGPDQGEVAEQDGGRGAEPGGPPAPRRVGVPAGEGDVHGRAAPAGGGGVHEVVVHERARLDQLQRGHRAQHRVDRRAVRVAARAAPAPPREGRADAACPRPARTRSRSPAAAPNAGRSPRRRRGAGRERP